jgi:hypothetical protein
MFRVNTKEYFSFNTMLPLNTVHNQNLSETLAFSLASLKRNLKDHTYVYNPATLQHKVQTESSPLAMWLNM